MIIESVILAAGYSSRAGSYKLTLDLYGKTVLERCIEGMYDVCSRIILVGGYQINDLIPIIIKYPKTELVYNQYFDTGMLSSVIEGFKHTDAERVFLIPGDYPLIPQEVYESLLAQNDDIVVPSFKGKFGHPLLISRKMINLLLSEINFVNPHGFIPIFNSLKDFIDVQGFKTIEVRSRGILLDIDTQEDYQNAKKYYRSLIAR